MYAPRIRYGFGKAQAAATLPPGSPALWFDAQDVNFGGGQPSDGAAIATWKNKGSLGSSGDLLQATGGLQPNFRLVATSGKINNKSSVQGDTTKWMKSGTFAARSTTCLVGFVMRATDFASSYGWYGGPAGAVTGMYSASGTGLLHMTGALDAVTTAAPTAATYNAITAVYSGVSSFVRLNGSATANVNPANQGITAMTLFGLDAGSFATNGHIVEWLFYDDATTAAQLETYFTAKYGATPQ